ncbi:MAG TPA: AlpA family phage regulatory protein [Gammaproteobacteria bacterium]|nr:AlpA family phage regulatory protein [Gammaproteobacteria bacterium]
MEAERYLTDRQVATRYGVSRITPWRWARGGDFPAAVHLGPSTTRWRLSDLLEWERSRQKAGSSSSETTNCQAG